ncbi:MAG: cohesin domain-containing protein, partial [Bacteroidota bacterium]
EDVSIDLNVTNFTNIGSFQFYIQADPAVLTFQNVTNFSRPGLTVGPAGGNTIAITWTNGSYTCSDGRLLTLNFRYNGLTSPIAFLPANCEVVEQIGSTLRILTGTFTNGAISPVLTNTEQAHIGMVPATSGNPVVVPITYTGDPTTKVGAIDHRIAYDPTKLTFISVTGSGLFPSFINATASSGIITIAWTSSAGVLINTVGTQFDLHFLYTGSNTTNISFSTGCVISAATSGNNIPVTYNDGNVSLFVPATSFVSVAPALNPFEQGQIVEVPLIFSGMNTTPSPANFNLNLAYDNPRMSFVGYRSAIQPMIVNSNGSNISITNLNSLSPLPASGQLVILRFLYNGVGTANINFAAGCQFSNGNPIVVDYTGGSVTPIPAIVNAKIGMADMPSSSVVPIPITFSSIPVGTDIGAVTMNIEFNGSKLTYLNAVNPHNASIQLIDNVLNIAWSSTTSTVINGVPFITLNFNYSSAGDATAQILFKDGCQLANLAGAIVPANWNSGGVNLKFKISGYLKYNNLTETPLNNSTIHLKSGATVVGTAITNASGYYEFQAFNGPYTLEAICPKVWGGVTNADLTRIRQHILLITPLTGLPFKAGDVNGSGTITNADLTLVRQKILYPLTAVFPIGNWVFDAPPVLLNFTDQIVNFHGLCSGDVNSSYIPPVAP